MRITAALVIIAIVAVSAWIGYKNKAIRGICGVLAIIISIYGASIITTAYYQEFSGLLEPFIGGVVDSAASAVMNEPDDTVLVHPLTDEEKKDMYNVAYSTLRQVGVTESAAERIAESERGKFDSMSLKMTASLSEKLCNDITYTAVFEICFILIAIVFAVIGNLLDFAFKIPDLKVGDQLIGAVFGAVRGVILVMTLVVILRYAGIILPEELKSGGLLQKLIENNPVARFIGM